MAKPTGKQGGKQKPKPPPEHQWKPGQSGNPAGRAKGAISLTATLKRKFREQPELAEALVSQIVRMAIGDPKTGRKPDMRAIEMLWNYMDGKPLQPIVEEIVKRYGPDTDPDEVGPPLPARMGRNGDNGNGQHH